MGSYQLKHVVVEAIQLVADIATGTHDPGRNESRQVIAPKGAWLVTTADGKQNFMSDPLFHETYMAYVPGIAKQWEPEKPGVLNRAVSK